MVKGSATKLQKSGIAAAFVLLASALLQGCFEPEVGEPKSVPCTVSAEDSAGSLFTLSGTVRYGHVATQTGPVKLNYTSGITLRPARRVLVQALDTCGDVVVEKPTDDSGRFTLQVPGGRVKVVVAAQLKDNSYAGTGYCAGARWDVRVVDNTHSKDIWNYDPGVSASQDTSSINIDIPLSHNGTSYTNRSAAPFALADTIVNALEKVCQAVPATNFPAVLVNWSPNNRPTPGDKTLGEITTSHFTVEAWSGLSYPQLYILGKEGVDTDEYDDHVVAHEFGHYLENSIYRSDTIGGSHGPGDMLDPRVAFGEGYGNAFSAMTFDNSLYIDTYGSRQASGFSINVASAPSSDQDRGIHSEKSAQYFLWKLYDNHSRSFQRIDYVLRNYQKSSAALTSLLTFASYYNKLYGGAADNLQTLWTSGTTLNLPYNALCAGTCSGSGDTEDPFDKDGDLGAAMSGSRTYSVTVYPTPLPTPLPTSGVRAAEFWNPYRELLAGTNAATAHEVIDAGPNSSYFPNKLGYVRLYRYLHNTGSNGAVRITLALGGGRNCNDEDYTDMVVYDAGRVVASDWSLGGCPDVQFSAVNGKEYVITVEGVQDSRSLGVPSYSITVAR